MKRYGHFWVYALIDPRNQATCYVGRTRRIPKTRLYEHIKQAQDYASNAMDGIPEKYRAKLEWIIELFQSDLKPEIVILDEWDAETITDANRLEDAHVAEMLRRGEPLRNHILSRRMKPGWYRAKYGPSDSPTDFIKRLKAGYIKRAARTPNATKRKSSFQDSRNLRFKRKRRTSRR